MTMLSINTTDRLINAVLSLHRNQKITLLIGIDLIALLLCMMASLSLLLEKSRPDFHETVSACILLAITTTAAFSVSGLYHSVTRYIDLKLLGASAGTLAVVILGVYYISLQRHSPSLPAVALLMYWLISIAYVAASRLAVGMLLNHQPGRPRPGDHLVAIYGAGDAGVQLALALRAHGVYRAVCFFDEKRGLDKRAMAGLRVVHASRLTATVNALCIRSVIVAIPSATPARLAQVSDRLRAAMIPFKIINGILDPAEARAYARPSCPIRIEQLLGRAPVPPRRELFAKCVSGKNVLVTGAGGSIGGELCRQIATLAPRRLHLLDHSEYALYTIRQELQALAPGLPIEAHLGSVCNRALLDRVLRGAAIDTIYHAAAYKHVTLVEENLVEGIRNNVLGAQAVAQAATQAGVATCVLISSDKAVRPSNVMGASKRIAERVFQAAATQAQVGTVFSMVRFGNVLGSSGSVVPLFQRQLEAGGPLTVTHPDAARYFMLIAEAAQLVIQAGAMACGGDLFVLDMGEPVRIAELARSMIALAGLSERCARNPLGDIEIRYVGLFSGEKLREELLGTVSASASEHPRILRLKEQAGPAESLERDIDQLLAACRGGEARLIDAMLQAIVDDYTPPRREPAAMTVPAPMPSVRALAAGA